MTFKKSMISIAAAAVIAAGITGCGSSSSTAATTTTTTTTTTQPTSIKAVDGYVMNAKVTAIWGDGNETNTTHSSTVLTDVTTKSQLSPAKAGSPSYDLSELTASQLENLIAVKMEYKAAVPGTGNIVYNASYFDADGDGEYNQTKGDVYTATNFAMYAPEGFSIISPISTLVYAYANTAVDANESNSSEIVAAALTKVAAALGLSETDMKTVDPVGAISSKPEYALINAMVGSLLEEGNSLANLKTFATSLVAESAPATASAAFTNLGTAVTNSGIGNSAAVFTDIADQLSKDSTLISDVKNWNLDSVRASTVTAGSLVVEHLTATDADYNVTDVSIDDVNASVLVSAGAKISKAAAAAGDLNDIQLQIAPKDANSTDNATIGFILKLANEDSNVVGDNNFTEVTVYIPVELNTTDVSSGTLGGGLLGTSTIEVEYTTDSGTRAAIDANASALGFSAITNPASTDLVTISNNIITLKADAILNQLETNISTATVPFTLDLTRIAKLQVAVVDSAGVLSKTNTAATKTGFWGTTTVTSDLGGLQKTGKTVLDLTYADMRTNATKANAEGNASVAATVDTGTNLYGAKPSIGQACYIDVNATTITNTDDNITLSFTDNSIDSAAEQNASISISESSSLISISKTALSDMDADALAYGSNDFNVTIDASAIIAAASGSHPTAVVSYKVTDEFGAAHATDQNMTITFNRAPTDIVFVGSNEYNVTITGADKNITAIEHRTTGADYNGTAVTSNAVDAQLITSLTDPDGDHNLTSYPFRFVNFASNGDGVANTDINVSANGLDLNASDINVSMSIGHTGDINVSGYPTTVASAGLFPGGDDYNFTVTVRGFDGNTTYYDENITFYFDN